jgi:hypothetical protein
MTRKLLPRLLAAAATLAGLVAVLTAFAGSGFAQGSAAEANYAPKGITEPSIVGTPQVGQTLTANSGQWQSDTALTFSYQWERCNATGASCANVSGAIGQSYVVQSGDVGSTFRVAVTATNSSGSATGTSNNTAAVGGTASGAPTGTAEPTITGTLQVGNTLTASTGTWTSATSLSFAFQWQRCGGTGTSCSAIPGSTAQTYTIQSADAGRTLRVTVTATNASGSTSATSNNTAAVGGGTPTGGIKLPTGKTSVLASSVTLPDRLVIDGAGFQPTRIHSRASFIARFHVSDANGNVVRGALVYALGLPYSWVGKATEVSTDQNGWATVSITPTRKLPLRRGHALVIFVRARVQGQSVLGGTSTRRLVQITTG